MKHALILALLLVAGCKMETPQVNRGCQPVEAIVTRWNDPGNESSVRVGEDIAFIVRGRTGDCAVEVSAYEDGVVRVKIGEPKAAATWDTVYQWPTKEMLREASDRAAAHADSVANLPEIPESSQAAKVAARDTFINGKLFHIDNDGTGRPCTSDHWHRDGAARTMTAAKVAAIMAANDITLPQVAAWLNTYNMDVVNRGAWMRPHWARSPVDQSHPAPTYYMFRPEIAVADTTVEFMVRGHIPGAWPATVQGVLLLQNGSALRGPVSEIGWSDNGSGAGALPGMIQ